MTDQPEQLRLGLVAETEAPQSKPKKTRSADVNHSSTTEDTKAMAETTKSADFETMLVELEKVVSQLEGELKLEEAMALFERGLGLSQSCSKYLREAQQKVELLKRTASGVQTENFAEEVETV